MELGLGLALALIQHLSVAPVVEDSCQCGILVCFMTSFPGFHLPGLKFQIYISAAMAAQMEVGLVEWRGCVAQLLNLISPVACFSEERGVLPVTIPNCCVNGAFGPVGTYT